MKKIFCLAIISFLISTSIFCQSSFYGWGVDNNIPALVSFKFNQITCSYDTISKSSNIAGCNISAWYNRGVATTCDYCIFGYWCPPNDSTILFLGLNQDTSFTINYPFPLRWNIEYEYNPSDNCLYILRQVDLSDSVSIYKCNLTTGQANILTKLTNDYGLMNGVPHYSFCDIDIDSNFMYCGSNYKIAKIDLTSGVIDTLFPYIDDTVLLHHNYGLYFDQDRRLIFSISTNYGIETRGYLVSYDPVTNEKNILSNLYPDFWFVDLFYDDENDIYTILSDKYYFYSTINGALVDSCPLLNDDPCYYHFYPKCIGSSGETEKPQPRNIKVYPTITYDRLFVELDYNTKKIYYNIYDNTGRLISSRKIDNINSSPIIVRLPQLVAGVYYIQIRTDNTIQSFKFLKS